MVQKAMKLMKKIEKEGYSVWIVGGFVRDYVMGRSTKNTGIDLITSCPSRKLEKMFETYDNKRAREKGLTYVVFEGYIFEIAEYRKDGKYKQSPITNGEIISVWDDLKHRDFTINAMLMRSNRQIIDIYGGEKNIKNKIIRTVGDPWNRFLEDKIRLLRMIRFATLFDFKIEKETWEAAKGMLVFSAFPERVWEEFKKMASMEGRKFARGIQMMDDLGLLAPLFWEVKLMRSFPYDKSYYSGGGVFYHTMEALKRYKGSDPLVNMGILFHDIGKIETYKLQKGRHTYNNHENASVGIVQKICRRYNVSNKEQKEIIYLVKNHMAFFDIPKMKNSRIAGLMAEGEINKLKEVAYADEVCRGRVPFKWLLSMEKLNKEKRNITIESVRSEIKKILNGDIVKDVLHISPSPVIGIIIKRGVKWIIDNNIHDKRRVEEWLLKNYSIGDVNES